MRKYALENAAVNNIQNFTFIVEIKATQNG